MLLQDQGTIDKAIAKGVTQFRELRSFFLFGGCGPQDQRDQGDGWGGQIDLGDGYPAAKSPDMFQEPSNIVEWYFPGDVWKPLPRLTRVHNKYEDLDGTHNFKPLDKSCDTCLDIRLFHFQTDQL